MCPPAPSSRTAPSPAAADAAPCNCAAACGCAATTEAEASTGAPGAGLTDRNARMMSEEPPSRQRCGARPDREASLNGSKIVYMENYCRIKSRETTSFLDSTEPDLPYPAF